jgi:hypothetical protein
MYIPPVKNSPLFVKKGEGQVQAGLTTNSFYALGSYAITKDVAVAVSGSATYTNLFKKGLWDIADPYAQKYIEASVGKINLMPESSIIMEIFGGYGYGDAINSNAKFYKYAVVPRYKSYYHLGFVQFDVGRRWSFMEVGGAFRFAVSNVHFNYSDKVTNENINCTFNNFHFEPNVFVAAGKGKVRPIFRWGFGLSRHFSQPIEIANKEYFKFTFHLSIGASFRF